MNVKKILALVGVAFFALMALAAFALGGIISGIIFLLIAFVCSPYRGLLLNLLPEKVRNKGIAIASAIVLSLAAFVGIPTDSTEPSNEVVEEVEETEATEEVKTVETEKTEEATDDKEDVIDDLEEKETVESTTEQKEEKTETQPSNNTESTSNTTTSNNETVSVPAAPVAPAPVTETQPQANNNAQAVAPTNGSPSTGTAPQSGIYYIVNAKNGKVHISSCSHLPDNDNQLIFGTQEEVINAGYSDPCGFCKPW